MATGQGDNLVLPKNMPQIKHFVIVLGIALTFAVFSPHAHADNPFERSILPNVIIPSGKSVKCSSPEARSTCADGTCSTSTGRGTCSGHGGVAGDASTVSQPTNTPEPQPTATPAPAPTNTPLSSKQASAPQVAAVSSAAMPTSGGILPLENSISVVIMGLGLLFMMVVGMAYLPQREI